MLIKCPVCGFKFEIEQKEVKNQRYIQCQNVECCNPSIVNERFEEKEDDKL